MKEEMSLAENVLAQFNLVDTSNSQDLVNLWTRTHSRPLGSVHEMKGIRVRDSATGRFSPHDFDYGDDSSDAPMEGYVEEGSGGERQIKRRIKVLKGVGDFSGVNSIVHRQANRQNFRNIDPEDAKRKAVQGELRNVYGVNV